MCLAVVHRPPAVAPAVQVAVADLVAAVGALAVEALAVEAPVAVIPAVAAAPLEESGDH